MIFDTLFVRILLDIHRSVASFLSQPTPKNAWLSKFCILKQVNTNGKLNHAISKLLGRNIAVGIADKFIIKGSIGLAYFNSSP